MINEAILQMSYWEIIAALLSIFYISLAIKQNIWCWIAAFFSTLIYSILFFDATLLMSSFLNAYYLIMAIYGWYSWKIRNDYKDSNLKISTLNLSVNAKIIVVLSIISIVLGYYMTNYTNASYAYLDSTITIFSLVATYMMTKKILDNWIYWIIIDSAAIYLYFKKEFYVTSILFLIYTILAFLAYMEWKKEYKSYQEIDKS
ncbi:nicotinamide mononucleotide transporter [Aliarcobacter cibarius]|uniref:nicotinamide riboside transporter PnuC n=1 Tax=Aliarcobacter cibarius TaxID=255507 RepID=UPI0012A361CA|nr:nicotinamide riboside transporter PnuC [Aliarcobacter cibarius]QEZ89023.1 nicotinamide mononucleotide transporter [Aliarcobacter cibarius]